MTQPTTMIRMLAVAAAALAPVPSLLAAFERSAVLEHPERPMPSPRTLDGERVRVQHLLDSRRYADAAAGARVLLARAPLDRTGLRVLAMAELAMGDVATAGEVVIDASFVSRRDPFTQLWMYDQAVSAGDMAEAARRADALARSKDFRRDGFQDLTALLEERGGTAAVAARLPTRPPWRGPYLAGLAPRSDPEAARILDLLATLTRTAAPPDARETAQVLWQMVYAGRGALAWAYWRGQRAGGAGRLVDDPDFAAVALPEGERAASPFGWSIRPDSVVRVTSDRDEAGNAALTIEASGGRGPMFVSRYVAVGAGTYRFSYAASGAAGDPDRVHPDFACIVSGALASATTASRLADGTKRIAADVIVPAGCGMLKLGITVEPGEGGTAVTGSIRGASFARAAPERL